MSEQQISVNNPACPVCTAQTDIKQVHREPQRELIVYKCRVCSVEYPVVANARPR